MVDAVKDATRRRRVKVLETLRSAGRGLPPRQARQVPCYVLSSPMRCYVLWTSCLSTGQYPPSRISHSEAVALRITNFSIGHADARIVDEYQPEPVLRDAMIDEAVHNRVSY